MTASVNEGSIVGYAVVPDGTPCDDTLTYLPGNSVTLSNESDNGTKVCFKASDALGNLSFKASDRISGIDTTVSYPHSPSGTLNPDTEVITFTIPEASDPAGVAKYIYTIEECDAAGNNCTTVVPSTEITSPSGDQTVSYPNPQKDNNRKYIFKLKVQDTLGNQSAEKEAIVDTVVLEILFAAGANGSISPTTSQHIFEGAPFSKITLPTPTANPGYKFKDWTNSLGQNPPSASTPVTAGTTYTANFEVDQNQRIWNYTVKYYLVGTTNPVPGIARPEDTGTAYIGENVTVTPPSAPAGYKLTSGQSTSFPVNADNTTHTLYYEVDNGQTFTYTVSYTKAGTVIDTSIQSVPQANPVVTQADIQDRTPTGYKLDTLNSTALPLTLTDNTTTVTVAYIVDQNQRIWDYSVSYLEEGANPQNAVHPEVTGQGYIGEVIPVAHTPKQGYVVNPNQATSLTVLEQTAPTTLTIWYKKDMDNDGIPDDTDDDIDGDGISNAEETQYGSNPRDPNSKPNKYDHEPVAQDLHRLPNAPKFTEDDVKNAITNKDTFPPNTQITLDPTVNLSTLQDTAGDKEVEVTVTYPDGSKDTVKVKIKVDIANSGGGNNPTPSTPVA